MSTTTATPSQRRQASKLPLGLQPYHVAFVLYLGSIVILGTTYSIIYGTHLQNVRISSGAGGSQYPSTLPGAAVAPSVQTGVDGSTNLGPIPPSILLPPNHALHFWANRKNIVNQIFVKKAWGWTTLAWLLQLFFLRLRPATTSSPTASGSAAAPRTFAAVGTRSADHKKEDDLTQQPNAAAATITSPVSISVLRYLFATSVWLLFANWFFGPPLSERILTATGAVCVPSTNPSQSPIEELYCRTRTPLSSSTHPALFSSSSSLASKKGIRAMWKGGHDISGHTFIIVLSSLLLLEDLAPYLTSYLSGTSLGNALFPNVSGNRRGVWTREAKVAIASTLALVGLWSWMLLNTAIYFHTPQEKVSGLVVALVAWLVLPKGN